VIFLIVLIFIFFYNLKEHKNCHVSIWHCATWSRQYDVAMAMSRVTIGCEKFQCSPCICFFISIWSQFFKNWTNFIPISNL